MPFTVKELIGDRPPPVTATPEERLEDVIARMRDHDFSQLPVVGSDLRQKGVLTSGSIVRTLSHLGTPLKSLQVHHAMDRKLAEYQVEADLFELLARLRDTYAVLIVDAGGRLTGIVTSYDTTEFFQRKAEDMMLVEDIESALKEMIRGAYANESGEADEGPLESLIASIAGARQERRKSSIKLLQRYLAEVGTTGVKFDKTLFDKVFDQLHSTPAPRSLDKLSFNDYVQLLIHEDRWSFFQEAFGFDREAIRQLLDGVRDTRNALAHFRGSLSNSERDRLRFTVDQLARAQQRLAPERTENPEPQKPVETPESDTGALVLEAEDMNQDGSRYAPLSVHLRSQSAQGQVRTVLSFTQIENLIRGRLPDTARQHRSWWANDVHSHAHSRMWLDEGWRVAAISIAEERVAFARARDRERLYIDFYSELQSVLREKAGFALRTASPAGQSWIWIAGVPEEGGQVANLSFSFALGNRFRVELYIDSGDKTYNKQVFDALYEQREAIESDFGAPLQWERLDERRASRVAAYHPGAITDEPEILQKLRDWALDAMLRFQKTIESRMREVVQRLAS